MGVCGVSEMGRLGAEMGPGVGLLGNFRPGRARAFEALRWAASSSSSTSSKHFMKPWRGGERLWAPVAITGPLCSLVFLTCGDSRGHQGGLWLSRSPPLKLLLVPRLWGNLKLLPVATPEGCAPNLPCLLLAPALGSSPTNADTLSQFLLSGSADAATSYMSALQQRGGLSLPTSSMAMPLAHLTAPVLHSILKSPCVCIQCPKVCPRCCRCGNKFFPFQG